MHISRPARRRAVSDRGPPARLDTLNICDLRLEMRIGVHPHEHLRPQPVIITLEVHCERSPGLAGLESVVCYERLVNGIRALAAEGHVELVETFADSVALWCLQEPRVHRVKVRVDKPAAIRAARSVGVTVEHDRIMLEREG